MTDPAAVLATFEEFKPVKTRKSVQIICEIPEERADQALAALGGFPQSGESVWVGIARVDEKLAVVPADEHLAEPTQTPEKTERLKGGPHSQRAGILCNDPAFQNWYHESAESDWLPDTNRAEYTARTLRFECNVESRAELDHNPEAARIFDQIEADYRASQAGINDDTLREQAR